MQSFIYAQLIRGHGTVGSRETLLGTGRSRSGEYRKSRKSCPVHPTYARDPGVASDRVADIGRGRRDEATGGSAVDAVLSSIHTREVAL